MTKEGALVLPSAVCLMTASLLLIGMFLCTPTHSHAMDEMELQKIFQLRDEDEWKSLWHSETHVRCRDQLLTHMEWACRKDIYRIDKKRDETPIGVFLRKARANTVIKPWTGYVARKKRENKSITDECCNDSGCTWEEYAEYCPAHRRIRIVRSRTRK